MKFEINALSPVRAVVASLRVTAAVHRVAANLGELVAKGVEAVSSEAAIRGLAEHLAEATQPLEAVFPRAGDLAARAAKIEVGLRRDIHGDVPEAQAAQAAPCPGKSRGARRRRAKAAQAAAVQAAVQAAAVQAAAVQAAAVQAAPAPAQRVWTKGRVEASFDEDFPKA